MNNIWKDFEADTTQLTNYAFRDGANFHLVLVCTHLESFSSKGVPKKTSLMASSLTRVVFVHMV